MSFIKIQEQVGKLFPESISKYKKSDLDKFLRLLNRKKLSIQNYDKACEFLFERKFVQDTYQVSIRYPVVKWMFSQGISPNVEKLFEIDKYLLRYVWNNLTLSHVKQLLYEKLLISPLVHLIWKYICISPGIHFIYNELKCDAHVFDFDFLHAQYAIEDTDLNDSILSTVQLLNGTTKTIEDLKKEEKLNESIIIGQKSEISVLRKEQVQIDEKLTKLKHLEYIKENAHLASAEWLMKEYVKTTTYVNRPTGKEWSNMTWHFQSCDHASKICPRACYLPCDEKYQELLNHHDQKFQHLALGPSHTVHYTHNSHAYNIKWCNGNVSQINIETKKERVLTKLDVYNILPSINMEHIVQKDDIDSLIDHIGDNHNNETIWLINDAKNQNIENLFYKSMNNWGLRNNSTVKITAIQLCVNTKLIESFLLLRRNTYPFCLFGFHGTNKTHPHTIVKSGLDPRFSSAGSSLYLGAGSYISLTAEYCQTGGYSHLVSRNADGSSTYQLIVVCFLPGRPYHEDSPASAVAIARRTPPSNFDSVTCITSNTRIWAVYEKCLAYPMYLITYTI